jgi:uncharacterized coiled-coil DUF342 family protein
MRGKLDVSNSPIEKMKLHNRKKMIKDTLTKIVLVLVFGLGGFYGGIYYGTNKFNNMMDKIYADYVFIKNDVDAFVKVSDPETIRHYVKELNKILDDITFLGKMVESGQLADEALTGFFKTYQNKLDDVNNKILELNTQHNELVFKFKEQVTRLTVETDDNLGLIQGLQEKIQEQNDYVNKLNVEIGQSVKQLEDNVQTIKNSKYGKKIWIVKK